MAALPNLWNKLLRAFGVERLRPHWVEPGNAITRAIAGGARFRTMDSWDDEPASPARVAAAETAASAPETEEEAPQRKGVAA